MAYGTATSFTITLASLVSAAARQSTEIDNTSNLYTDVMIEVKVKTAAATTASAHVNVYAFANVNDLRSGGAGASDAAITLQSPPNVTLLGAISTPTASSTYTSKGFQLGAAFGGAIPAKWGIVVENQTGQALDGTEGNHAYAYRGRS